MNCSGGGVTADSKHYQMKSLLYQITKGGLAKNVHPFDCLIRRTKSFNVARLTQLRDDAAQLPPLLQRLLGFAPHVALLDILAAVMVLFAVHQRHLHLHLAALVEIHAQGHE